MDPDLDQSKKEEQVNNVENSLNTEVKKDDTQPSKVLSEEVNDDDEVTTSNSQTNNENKEVDPDLDQSKKEEQVNNIENSLDS